MSREFIGYYQSDIRTSRKENSDYDMTYTSQQTLIDKLQQENQELKKQLEEKENQQKEFVEYLESEIKRLENTEFYIESIQKAAIKTHKQNLSKYKSIIGSDKSE